MAFYTHTHTHTHTATAAAWQLSVRVNNTSSIFTVHQPARPRGKAHLRFERRKETGPDIAPSLKLNGLNVNQHTAGRQNAR